MSLNWKKEEEIDNILNDSKKLFSDINSKILSLEIML